MVEDIKDNMVTISHQIENVLEIEIIKKNQMKNSLEGLNNRFELAEEIISELEDSRSIEIMQSKEEKRMNKKRASEKCRTPLNAPTYT